jgi:RNA recognition motif-containing protein
MGRKLYVANLPFSVNKQTLQDRFSQCGTVDSVDLITDRDTGQCKGFAFIEMSSNDEAQQAIQELNGSSLDGRKIKVNEAKPKVPRHDRRGGGGGGYGGGGGRGGRGYGSGGDRGNR